MEYVLANLGIIENAGSNFLAPLGLKMFYFMKVFYLISFALSV